MAALLDVLPALFVTTHLNCLPLSPATVPGVVQDALVAPDKSTQPVHVFSCHWYVNGAVPAAATVNVAVWPSLTEAFAGCVIIVGGTPAVTVSVTALLVALPALLVTTHWNCFPLSPATVTDVV
jgi:hypothetical protein